MDSEQYEGWASRETWALMLWVNNDQGLYEMFRERAREDAEANDVQRRDNVEALARELLNPDEYRNEYGTEQPEGLRRVAAEVGSLWRVDWAEVVSDLMEN